MPMTIAHHVQYWATPKIITFLIKRAPNARQWEKQYARFAKYITQNAIPENTLSRSIQHTVRSLYARPFRFPSGDLAQKC
jgi:hypothetical protein